MKRIKTGTTISAEFRPTKNWYYCIDCHRSKMLFKTQREAERFIHFNAERIENESGERPARAYYCRICGGWHVTSLEYSYSRTDLSRRFGMARGNEMFYTLKKLLGKGKSVSQGIRKKMKELHHNLKFDIINIDKCQSQILDLIEAFEIVIKTQLDRKDIIKDLFEKFQLLCNEFIRKRDVALHS